MSMEYKKIPYFLKEMDESKRLVTGIFAVHGNVDDGGDVSEPGSFAKRLGDGSRPRVRFLWNHRSFDPPIASIKSIREVLRTELPDKVLAWAPGATGGVEVTRKYYQGVELADWVFQAVKEGDVAEMSYAYQVHEYAIKTDDVNKREVRILKDVELYDVSDVNWGMNPATAGVKHVGIHSDVERMRALLAELKEGRMLSASNRDKVSSAVGAMESAVTALNELLSASDGKGLPETGETLNERSARLATSLEEFVGWVQARKSVRDAEGRALSGALRERLAKMATEIAAVIEATEPAADQKDVRHEQVRFLQIQSQIQIQ
jgi:HK97 family phage prohead protease